MDVPIDDLKAIFGDFEKNQRNQTKILTDLFKILTGDKTLPSTNRANSFYAKLNPTLAVEEEEKEAKQGKGKESKNEKTAAVTAEAKKNVQPRTAAVISAAVKKEAVEPKEKRTPNRVVATIVFGPKAVSILDSHFKFIGDKISSTYFANTSLTREIFKNLSGKLNVASRVLGKKIWDGMKDLGSKFKDYSLHIGSKIMAGLKSISFKGIGEKITSITGGLGRGFDAIKGVFKLPKKETSSPKGETKTPYSRQSVEVILPPKTRVVLEDILEGANVSLFDKVKPYLENISTAISKIKISDKDKKKDGMFGFLKDIFPLVARLLGPVIGSLGTVLLGAGAAIGSVALLINGLFDNGPLKGLKKLLGRGGLALGTSLITKGVARLNKAVTTLFRFAFGKEATENLFKAASKELSKIGPNLLGFITNTIKSFRNGILKFFMGFVGKSGIKTALRASSNIFKILSEQIGKLLGKNVLKRIPGIGAIIGLGFAFSRFKSGDIIGGLIDVMSAIASIVPGVGTAVSIGLDVLNAFLDAKGGGPEGRAKSGGGGITKVLLRGLGAVFKNVFKKIPVIGTVLGLGFAFSRFKSGDIVGGFIDVVSAIASLVPGVGTAISVGLDVLNAFLDSKNTDASGKKIGKGKLIGNWLGDAMKWIGGKIWWVLKKIPIISAFVNFSNKKWKEGFRDLAYTLPGVGLIYDLVAGTSVGKAIGGAVDAAQAKSVNFGDFFKNFKNNLLRKLLKFIPEKILGFSVRSRVAKMLGISDKEDADEEHKGMEVKGEKLSAATPVKASQKLTTQDLKKAPGGIDQKDWGALNDKQKDNALKQYEKIKTEKDLNSFKAKIHQLAFTDKYLRATGLLKDKIQEAPAPTVKAAAPEVPKTVQPTQTGPGIGDVHDTLKEQNGLILKMLSFNKQTANNTGGLLGTMNTPSKNVSVVNVTNNPTAFLTNPVRSTDFRSQMFN